MSKLCGKCTKEGFRLLYLRQTIQGRRAKQKVACACDCEKGERHRVAGSVVEAVENVRQRRDFLEELSPDTDAPSLVWIDPEEDSEEFGE